MFPHGADQAFPLKGQKIETEVSCTPSTSCFFASVKSMKQLSAVRGHMDHSKGVFAVTLKSEFHLEGESVV